MINNKYCVDVSIKCNIPLDTDLLTTGLYEICKTNNYDFKDFINSVKHVRIYNVGDDSLMFDITFNDQVVTFTLNKDIMDKKVGEIVSYRTIK